MDSQTRQDNRISIIFAVYYLSSVLNKSIKSVFTLSAVTWKMMSLSFEGLIALSILWSIQSLINRQWRSLLGVEVLLGLLFGYSILTYPGDGVVVDNCITSLVICVPLGVYCAALDDKSRMLHSLEKISPICVLAGAVACYYAVGMGGEDYSMSLSYSLALFIMVLFNSVLTNRKIINLFLVIIGTIVVIVWGSRGPTLVLAVFFLLRFFGGKKSVQLHQFVFRVLIAFAILGAVWFLDDIIAWVVSVLNKYGFRSRTLSLLLTGRYLYSSGRDTIQEKYWELIRIKPLYHQIQP